ncbi:MAG: TPM domain-containing protein [Clostridiales bacterium]|nr:TPM domain-containing protein [Clostridiales bacterium]
MKRLISLLTALFICTSFVFSAHPPRVVDDADLLTDSQEEELAGILEGISKTWQCDVVIVTVSDTGGKTTTEYADDYFDYNGYGYGESYDGLLLLVDMGSRMATISTCGMAIDVFSDYDLDKIEDEYIPHLSDGDYMKAFETFAYLCDDYIREDLGTQGGAGMARTRMLSPSWIPGSIIVGIIIAFISTAVMKSKLKSVRFKTEASDYVRQGSFKVTDAHETFLYSKVTKVAKQKSSSSSSGGSSTHRSSSGRSHGGSSRSF